MDAKKLNKYNKISIYGDSISTVNYGDGGYENMLKESLFLDEIYNFSISSSGLSLDTPNNMVSLIKEQKNIPKDVDLILIWHGSNDWYWGTEIGNLYDNDVTTFWGGIDFVIKKLRKTVPMAKIVWITPIFRKEMPYLGDTVKEGYELKNIKGYTLLDYYKIIELASKKYGFNLIDMRRLTNFHEDNAKYFLEDNVHPNKYGYKIIHNILNIEIKKLLSN